jgi:anti-sigma-K factor RskA
VNKQQLLESGVLECYALGIATAEEKLAVEQLLASNPDLKAELSAIEEAVEQFGEANGSPVAAHMRDKILRRISLEDSNAGQQKSFATHIGTRNSLAGAERASELGKLTKFNFSKLAAAASVALLIGAGYFIFNLSNKNKQLAIQLENKKTELAIERDNNVASQEEMQIIHSKYTVPLKLTADHAPKDCDAKIYMVTNTNEVYLDASNLPAVPKGKQYQLWAINEGAATDCGLIALKRNSGFQKMKSFGKVDAFAITLENEGGVTKSKEKPFVIIGHLREFFDEYHHQHCEYHKE